METHKYIFRILARYYSITQDVEYYRENLRKYTLSDYESEFISVYAFICCKNFDYTQKYITDFLGYSHRTMIWKRLNNIEYYISNSRRVKPIYENVLFDTDLYLNKNKLGITDIHHARKELKELLIKIKDLKSDIESIRSPLCFAKSLSNPRVHYAYDDMGNEYLINDGKCKVSWVQKAFKVRNA